MELLTVEGFDCLMVSCKTTFGNILITFHLVSKGCLPFATFPDSCFALFTLRDLQPQSLIPWLSATLVYPYFSLFKSLYYYPKAETLSLYALIRRKGAGKSQQEGRKSGARDKTGKAKTAFPA